MCVSGPVQTLGVRVASMRWIPLFAIVALGACAGPKNTFVVEDPQGLVTGATLRLCGSETPLARQGTRLSLAQSVSCEGDGEIRLINKTGRMSHCIVGYVTPDAKQGFRFRADQSSCRTLA